MTKKTKTVWRIDVEARDRWSGPEYWTKDFDTEKEANDFFNKEQEERKKEYKQNRGVAPEYYENYSCPRKVELVMGWHEK